MRRVIGHFLFICIVLGKSQLMGEEKYPCMGRFSYPLVGSICYPRVGFGGYPRVDTKDNP